VADDIVTRLRSAGKCLDGHICSKCDREVRDDMGCKCVCHDYPWGDAADEIERLRAMVDWFVDHRLWDFDDHPEYGPGLAYDGIISGETLPDDIVQAFRQAVLLEEERIRRERREEARRG
jgi:hypothetical protein